MYETAKSKEEIERRLRGIIEYMKWKSEETLAAYQHYFDEQQHADTHEQFHKRMHQEVQYYLEERRRGKRGKYSSPNDKNMETSPLAHTVLHLDDEPDLAFLYSLAEEA
jgi:hypothetical protein